MILRYILCQYQKLRRLKKSKHGGYAFVAGGYFAIFALICMTVMLQWYTISVDTDRYEDILASSALASLAYPEMSDYDRWTGGYDFLGYDDFISSIINNLYLAEAQAEDPDHAEDLLLECEEFLRDRGLTFHNGKGVEIKDVTVHVPEYACGFEFADADLDYELGTYFNNRGFGITGLDSRENVVYLDYSYEYNAETGVRTQTWTQEMSRFETKPDGTVVYNWKPEAGVTEATDVESPTPLTAKFIAEKPRTATLLMTIFNLMRTDVEMLDFCFFDACCTEPVDVVSLFNIDWFYVWGYDYVNNVPIPVDFTTHYTQADAELFVVCNTVAPADGSYTPKVEYFAADGLTILMHILANNLYEDDDLSFQRSLVSFLEDDASITVMNDFEYQKAEQELEARNNAKFFENLAILAEYIYGREQGRSIMRMIKSEWAYNNGRALSAANQLIFAPLFYCNQRDWHEDVDGYIVHTAFTDRFLEYVQDYAPLVMACLSARSDTEYFEAYSAASEALAEVNAQMAAEFPEHSTYPYQPPANNDNVDEEGVWYATLVTGKQTYADWSAEALTFFNDLSAEADTIKQLRTQAYEAGAVPFVYYEVPVRCEIYRLKDDKTQFENINPYELTEDIPNVRNFTVDYTIAFPAEFMGKTYSIPVSTTVSTNTYTRRNVYGNWGARAS